jgi:hypothetical protein
MPSPGDAAVSGSERRRRRRAGWTPGRVWCVWAVGHAVGVVPLAVTYLVDGYASLPHDLRIYAEWGAALVAGDGLPAGDGRWQYPPGAALLLAVPAALERLAGIGYPVGFVAGMLAVDAAVTAVLLSRRSASAAGLWAVGGWAVGQVMFTRFDVVPAGLAVLALLAATNRKWVSAGAVLGAGALVKVWPVLLLPAFGYRRRPGGDERDDGNGHGDGNGEVPTRIRDVRALAGGIAAAAAGLAALLAATGWWRDVGSFLGAQQARGLQLEAVPATPFVFARLFGVGEAPAYEFGSMQFSSGAAQAVATACSLAGVGLVVAATVWWWGMGRTSRSSAADRALILLALVVVTARVLSPQYLIWLLAVAACRPAPWACPDPAPTTGPAPTTDTCAVAGRAGARRPAVLLLTAALLSQLVYPMTYDGLVAGEILPSVLLVARNGVLVALCLTLIRSAGGAGGNTESVGPRQLV